jgi:hypothetical protein
VSAKGGYKRCLVLLHFHYYGPCFLLNELSFVLLSGHNITVGGPRQRRGPTSRTGRSRVGVFPTLGLRVTRGEEGFRQRRQGRGGGARQSVGGRIARGRRGREESHPQGMRYC